MSYLKEKEKYIEYFMEGIMSVCNDKTIIANKTKEHFGEEYSKLIDYFLLLTTEKFNGKALATALKNRDLDDGFYEFELKCAENSNLVIVIGYSDDLIILKGAIKQESDCFMGGDCHLENQNDEWILKEGKGLNNISAVWCDSNKKTENLEWIPWTYKTDIPHESFFMTFRGDPFCEGFVFRIEDLKLNEEQKI